MLPSPTRQDKGEHTTYHSVAALEEHTKRCFLRGNAALNTTPSALFQFFIQTRPLIRPAVPSWPFGRIGVSAKNRSENKERKFRRRLLGDHNSRAVKKAQTPRWGGGEGGSDRSAGPFISNRALLLFSFPFMGMAPAAAGKEEEEECVCTYACMTDRFGAAISLLSCVSVPRGRNPAIHSRK